ncbi:MAG: glycosyltransferase family 4 protein [Alphaproteobacteria bacterium]|nr:glycosyltransferase family 4 protein [Alphaproteobacteria bacterium]
MRIILADDGMPFEGRMADERPLGGAESAVVNLLNALAARGNDVAAYTSIKEPVTHRGVAWQPITDLPEAAPDLFIANRSWRLLRRMPDARRTVFWIHNPAHYLLKWRFLWRLALTRPAIVFSGEYHASTYPAWAPAGTRLIIPYGIDERFRSAAVTDATPPPRAIFTSNPLRGLDWLLDLWAARIWPELPEAELHIFAGAAVYGGEANPKASSMAMVLARAEGMANRGVRVRGAVPKSALVEELAKARVMLYRGDPGETFCLAVGEAQAMGVPAVVQPIGSLAERVRDGETGAVASSDEAFARAALHLLKDEGAWERAHRNALLTQRQWSWNDCALAFEALEQRTEKWGPVFR